MWCGKTTRSSCKSAVRKTPPRNKRPRAETLPKSTQRDSPVISSRQCSTPWRRPVLGHDKTQVNVEPMADNAATQALLQSEPLDETLFLAVLGSGLVLVCGAFAVCAWRTFIAPCKSDPAALAAAARKQQ